MKKPKKSTKVLLVLIPTFIILGIIFTTIGFLKGISTWYFADGITIKTSNMYKSIEEKKEIEPFSSINLTCPFTNIEIKKGEKFSVEYSSHRYLVEPDVYVSDGVLNIADKGKSKESAIDGELIINSDKFRDENTIVITVPEGTALEDVELNRTIRYETTARATYTLNETHVSDIEIKNLSVDRTNNVFNRSSIEITNCKIEDIYVSNSRNCNVNNSQIGKLIFDNNFPVNYVEGLYSVVNTTVNYIETKYPQDSTVPDEFGYMHTVMELKNSKILSANIVISSLNANTCEIANAKVYARDIQVHDTVLTGENDFDAVRDISINLAQKETDLNCDISRLVKDENAVTEIVDFDDPRYGYGYVNAETAKMGLKPVKVTEEEYNNLINNRQIRQAENYSNDNNWEYATTYQSLQEDPTITQGNKFDEYVSSDYYSDDLDQSPVITVYQYKAITYKVSADGQIAYFDLKGKAMDENHFLTIGSEKNNSQFRISKPAQSANSLKCHSEDGSVSVNFAN